MEFHSLIRLQSVAFWRFFFFLVGRERLGSSQALHGGPLLVKLSPLSQIVGCSCSGPGTTGATVAVFSSLWVTPSDAQGSIWCKGLHLETQACKTCPCPWAISFPAPITSNLSYIGFVIFLFRHLKVLFCSKNSLRRLILYDLGNSLYT